MTNSDAAIRFAYDEYTRKNGLSPADQINMHYKQNKDPGPDAAKMREEVANVAFLFNQRAKTGKAAQSRQMISQAPKHRGEHRTEDLTKRGKVVQLPVSWKKWIDSNKSAAMTTVTIYKKTSCVRRPRRATMKQCSNVGYTRKIYDKMTNPVSGDAEASKYYSEWGYAPPRTGHRYKTTTTYQANGNGDFEQFDKGLPAWINSGEQLFGD